MKCLHCGKKRAIACNGNGQTARYSQLRHDMGIGDDPYVYWPCPNVEGKEPIFSGPVWHRQVVGYK